MKKIKDMLSSENGMRIVNGLCLFSLLFYRSGLIFIAYGAWILYLLFCLKNTRKKGSRIIYSLFIAIAVIMIILNLYFAFER